MVFLIVFCSLLLLVALILATNLRIHFEVTKDGTLRANCRFLFLELFRLKEDGEDESCETDNEKGANGKKRLQLKKYIKSYNDVIELLHTVKNILVKFKALLSKVVVKNTEMELVIVGADAAATAIMYGSVCSVVYPIINLLSACCTFKPDKLNVSAGFTEKEMSFYLSTDFTVRVIHLLKFAIISVFEILKLKKELE